MLLLLLLLLLLLPWLHFDIPLQILEDIPTGTTLAKFSATDSDHGDEIITYSIRSGTMCVCDGDGVWGVGGV